MTNDRQIITEDIVVLARQNPNQALERINKLLTEFPSECWVWSLRSHVNKIAGNFENALSDIEHAININFEDPSHHQEKAIILMEFGFIESAIKSFSNAIEIGKNFNIVYYDSYCRFMRAFCFCKIGNFDAAERDLQEVDDDTVAWVDRLRSKADLLDACHSKNLN